MAVSLRRGWVSGAANYSCRVPALLHSGNSKSQAERALQRRDERYSALACYRWGLHDVQIRSPPNGPMPLFPAHSTADLGADLDLPLSPLVVTSRRRWSTSLGRQPEVLRGARE
ncbi:hypothetical protein OIDMADRAFT_24069 [Oidiodendron maius Zn]|uniref:Uncharacterized protein n=1 Tax=Oidiodendron maius (strain Zn) TaxID=913774 RepID=A0A0C3HTY6_OIDMZ|nr:hypothetical protein OIDMADRAFT_24069 [Oidiodendron maius Zn]